jgi:hypothetical protein
MENQTNTKFEVGVTYEMRFITDSDLKVPFTCIKRTEKRATFSRQNSKEVITKGIKTYMGEEYANYGSYSMAPSINSRHTIN